MTRADAIEWCERQMTFERSLMKERLEAEDRAYHASRHDTFAAIIRLLRQDAAENKAE